MNASDVKIGTMFVLNGDPYEVLFREHSKMGRGGAVLRTKIKNLRTGTTKEETFKGTETFEEATVSVQKLQFLYRDEDNFYFMNPETFDQISVEQHKTGLKGAYIIDGMDIDAVFFEGNLLDIKIPIKMVFRVVEAPPCVKGDTATGGSKMVKLENGLEINVPLFIKEGDLVRVNTERGEYVERA